MAVGTGTGVAEGFGVAVGAGVGVAVGLGVGDGLDPLWAVKVKPVGAVPLSEGLAVNPKVTLAPGAIVLFQGTKLASIVLVEPD